jgi:putative SOS response-associated peptidase YedK
MPVVLDPDQEDGWLDPERSETDLMSLLAPAPPGLLVLREVGDAVNDVREDGPHLIEPREPQAQAQLL